MFIELTIYGKKELVNIRDIGRVSVVDYEIPETQIYIYGTPTPVSETYDEVKQKISEADQLKSIAYMLDQMLIRMDNGIWVRELIENPDLPFNGQL